MKMEPFTLDDIEYDLAELEPPDWDAMAARIRWHLSTPYAVALKSIFGEALVSGLGTAVAHTGQQPGAGGSGWVGERLMHPRYRGAELEGELVAALVQALEAKGCTTQLALVEEASVPVFEAQGFVADGHYVRYGGGQCEAPTLDEVEIYEPHHSLGVLRLDQLATGEDRRTFISEHCYASRVFVHKGRVQGTYMVLLGEGLIVAENVYAGEELLRWHMPHVTQVTLPLANQAAIEFLELRKYTEQQRWLRMVRGAPVAWRPELVYGWAGRNFG